MSPINAPSPDQLNEWLEDVKRKFEEILLKRELRQTGYEFRIVRVNNRIVIQFPTYQKCMILLNGPEMSPESTQYFYTVVKVPTFKGRDGRVLQGGLRETVKVTVEIFDEVTTNCFTNLLHEKSIERVLAAAIDSYENYRGIKLQPVLKKRAKRKKNNNQQDETEPNE
jgi:hypothetical protein